MFITSSIFWLGAFGGFSGEALHWWGLRESQNLPIYSKNFFYWGITIIMIFIGAGIALLQLGSGGDPFLAFQLGILAPMLLKKIISSAPQSGGMGNSRISQARKFIQG